MVKKNAYIVLGLGYGDEGKGLTTDFLCSKYENAIVIRFNGGHQAGHTVVHKNYSHIFSSFGSGTLRNRPTYWSKYCTFSPFYFIEELEILPIKPIIFIDKKCPITTHYDILFNRSLEITRGSENLGSCGVGFGATVDREKDGLNFHFSDIYYDEKIDEKLSKIKYYYRKKINIETAFDFDSFSHDEEDRIFKDNIKKIREITNQIIFASSEQDIFSNNSWNTYIFEGAQGILLDKKFGNKPYITKSNATSKNALKILSRQSDIVFNTEIYYVTRAYHTRHGNGPFREKEAGFSLKNKETETNQFNLYQKEFRTSFLDFNLVNYSINCDLNYSKNICKNLMITCLDQIDHMKINVYENNVLKQINYLEFKDFIHCRFKTVKYSFSNCSDNLDK